MQSKQQQQSSSSTIWAHLHRCIVVFLPLRRLDGTTKKRSGGKRPAETVVLPFTKLARTERSTSGVFFLRHGENKKTPELFSLDGGGIFVCVPYRLFSNIYIYIYNIIIFKPQCMCYMTIFETAGSKKKRSLERFRP
jgi:hypothetical protein